MTVSEYVSRSRIKDCLHRCRESRKLVLIIVAIALLLDNMLLTTVVPIIPEFLYAIRHRNDIYKVVDYEDNQTDTYTTMVPLLSELDNDPRRLLKVNYTEYTPASDDTWVNMGSNTFTGIKGMVCYPQQAPRRIPKTSRAIPTQSDAERHEELISENVEVGVMFASKALVQLLTNPFIGTLTNRIGYSVPMFAGFIIMFLSTIIFAFGRTYSVLCIARALQGVGSSCSTVSGMGMLADRFPDDQERGNAMGLALGGLALGVLIGPPFGGVMYQFVGKTAPFIILAGLALGDGLMQLLVLQPTIKKQDQEGASLLTLLKDPYILIAAGAITFANTGIAMLEPSLPIYMMDTMHSPKWQLGAAFLPASISYLIGTNVFGPLGHRIGRWRASLIGLIIVGICIMLVPQAKTINHLILPNAGIGFALGMVDSSMMPQLGFLVDIRHAAVYGSVYAIGDIAFCLGFAIGPALSGTLVQTVGFAWMLYGIAIIDFLYAPLMIFLKNPPRQGEKQSLIIGDDCPIRYVTYNPDGMVTDPEDND